MFINLFKNVILIRIGLFFVIQIGIYYINRYLVCTRTSTTLRIKMINPTPTMPFLKFPATTSLNFSLLIAFYIA